MTNCLVWAVSDTLEDTTGQAVYSVARRIRDSLHRVRDPEYCAVWDVAHEQRMLDMASNELVADFTQDPGNWVLNSTWR